MIRPVTFRPAGLPRFTDPELHVEGDAGPGGRRAVTQVAPLLEIVPLKPFPEASWTVVPLPSVHGYQATGAANC